MIHYGVSKTGQLAVSRGLAEMTKGTNVTVNTVLPGPTRSEANAGFIQGLAADPSATLEQAEKEFFEKNRPASLIQWMADGSEVASLVAYLASPLAGATNGAAIRCEGGILRAILGGWRPVCLRLVERPIHFLETQLSPPRDRR
jgi:NAD(P)-dependent dehydrogenase (short-subunit alcohol dehydrogenase family)